MNKIKFMVSNVKTWESEDLDKYFGWVGYLANSLEKLKILVESGECTHYDYCPVIKIFKDQEKCFYGNTQYDIEDQFLQFEGDFYSYFYPVKETDLFKKWVINSDGSYDVNGDVKLNHTQILNGKLIYKFRNIKGNFEICVRGGLSSLDGFPEKIEEKLIFSDLYESLSLNLSTDVKYIEFNKTTKDVLSIIKLPKNLKSLDTGALKVDFSKADVSVSNIELSLLDISEFASDWESNTINLSNLPRLLNDTKFYIPKIRKLILPKELYCKNCILYLDKDFKSEIVFPKMIKGTLKLYLECGSKIELPEVIKEGTLSLHLTDESEVLFPENFKGNLDIWLGYNSKVVLPKVLEGNLNLNLYGDNEITFGDNVKGNVHISNFEDSFYFFEYLSSKEFIKNIEGKLTLYKFYDLNDLAFINKVNELDLHSCDIGIEAPNYDEHKLYDCHLTQQQLLSRSLIKKKIIKLERSLRKIQDQIDSSYCELYGIVEKN